ncbi:M20 family metallo-hydrolase [Desulfoferula mesophila]|uniref:Diaminopimelate aminotransferase n=1 Tax=Desulfoferula mesophila TaxID=3058419 RepID=A0AAU9EKI9_9BACT|nr:diaminopimelate aminotransferase [Desulfoferula mesophilus]
MVTLNPIQQLMARVATYRQSIIELQRQLVATEAVGPDNRGTGEMEKALLVQQWLEAMGLELERIDAPDARVPGGLRPNLAAVLHGGEGPRIWVVSHLDVVPPGSAELWSSDPWTLREDGDLIFGRGTQDNNAGLVSSLLGLRALLDLHISPPGQVGLLMVGDEETGSAFGLDFVLQARPELLRADDWIVVPDAGREDASLIQVAEKSQLWLRVEVRGRQAHASRPQQGVNALRVGARMIARLGEVTGRYQEEDKMFAPPKSTFEPTRIEPGVENVNTVPGRFVFYLDCRILPHYPFDEVKANLVQYFEGIAAEENAQAVVTPVQERPATRPTPKDSPVVVALRRLVQSVHGVEPEIGGIGGGTVAAFLRKRGIPAAVWATVAPTAHQPNEYAKVSNILKDAQVFALLFAGA